MNTKKYLFDNPKNVKLLIRALYVSCFVLFAMDLVIHRHTVHPWESFIGFYAIYGFLACVILVLLARELRKVVMRDEDYYDRREK
jgi:Ca2+/Na+ antiporter